jgi:hypothetical protein
MVNVWPDHWQTLVSGPHLKVPARLGLLVAACVWTVPRAKAATTGTAIVQIVFKITSHGCLVPAKQGGDLIGWMAVSRRPIAPANGIFVRPDAAFAGPRV